MRTPKKMTLPRLSIISSNYGSFAGASQYQHSLL